LLVVVVVAAGRRQRHLCSNAANPQSMTDYSHNYYLFLIFTN